MTTSNRKQFSLDAAVVGARPVDWRGESKGSSVVQDELELHQVKVGRTPREERFEQVLAEYEASFCRLAAAYERDRDLQQDLFQEIALAIWKALPTFRNQCSERTFLYRIAHNRAITHIRDGRFPQGDLDLATSLPDPSASPEANVRRARQKDELLQRVSGLPLNLRQVVVLALEGMENHEIAEVLGISAGNVAVRLHRAKHQLIAGGSRK
jgi:RNA polymerase sigma factor (sigma-70 family)